MARYVELTGNKTYATRENAVKAVDKFMAALPDKGARFEDQTYFVHTGADGRFFPVFVGERAIQAMLHFHFNVVA